MAGAYAFVEEVFAAMGPVSVRPMFGGAGVYSRGVMFAAVMEGAIYIKTDDKLKAELAALDSAPFLFTPSRGPNAGKAMEMSYWRMPESALDDPEEAAEWGKRALVVAAAKPVKKKKPAKRP